MTLLSISTVKHICDLSFLPTDNLEKYAEELSSTLAFIDTLNEIDIQNINPTYQVTGNNNVMREDVAQVSLSQEDALKNANDTYNGFFKVKAIWD